MGVSKKYATIVSVDYDLNDIAIGEQVVLKHDVHNEYDKKAMSAFRGQDKAEIGYVSASPHTTLKDCETNQTLIEYIPSPQVPLIGKVVKKSEVSYRNGTIAPVLKLEIFVVSREPAV